MEGTTGHDPTGTTRPATRPSVDVRQQLAADRTLLAWVRTSIAMAALGFVVARFDLAVRETSGGSTTWNGARVLGVVLVAAAVLVGLIGLFQYRQVGELLASHGEKPPESRTPAIIGSAVSLVALVGLAAYLATGIK